MSQSEICGDNVCEAFGEPSGLKIADDETMHGDGLKKVELKLG
jgi:hypothetical protein